jgi:hypothetical protein
MRTKKKSKNGKWFKKHWKVLLGYFLTAIVSIAGTSLYFSVTNNSHNNTNNTNSNNYNSMTSYTNNYYCVDIAGTHSAEMEDRNVRK